jgi:hypothetical protein
VTSRSVCLRRERHKNAVTSNIDGFGGGGSSALGGEQFHPDAGDDQVAVERSGGDCHGSLAAEHFWTISFDVANTRWSIGVSGWHGQRENLHIARRL